MRNFAVRCLATAVVLPLAVSAPIQLQPLWALDPGARPYLPGYPGDNAQRGIAYNPMTGNLLLVNRTGGLSVQVIHGTTGADRGTLNTTGISGGTFSLSQIAVAADGAIYAANLVNPSSGASPFRIYRWANESFDTAPTLVYSGQPAASTRWGDNIEIRGSGNNTQILFGQGGNGVGNRIAVFTTSDAGASFTPNVMTLSGQEFEAGGSRGGVAFGEGNTFFTKDSRGTRLYYGTFDLATSSAVLTASPTLGGGTGPSGFSALGTLVGDHLLAALNINATANPQTGPHNVVLFDITNPSLPITLDAEPFINPGAQNSNAAGAVDFGGGKLFALDTNNGLRAYDLIPEPETYALLGLGLGALWLARRRRPV